MAFGVFDMFHKGHEHFLSKAKERCDGLIVVVTPPETVELMKKRLPEDSLERRMASVSRFGAAVPGDRIMGSWEVLKAHQPDIVFLGYDQQGIAGELDKLGIRYAFIDPFQPETYKSSLLRKAI